MPEENASQPDHPQPPAEGAAGSTVLPCGIQPYAALLAGRRGHPEVLHASANLAGFLGISPEAALGRLIRDLIPGLDSETYALSGLGLSRTFVFNPPNQPETERIATCHQNHETWCVQIEASSLPETESPATAIKPDELLRLSRSSSINALLSTAVSLFRSLLGYHRVVIFKLHEDCHGEVVAESRQGNRARFIGLHFPASEIPEESRERSLNDRLHLIPDLDSAPVPLLASPAAAGSPDLVGCCARAASPRDIRYMRLMALRASLVVSLVVDGKLWGLLSCHHDAPRYIPPVQRDAALSLAEMVCVQVAALTSRQHSLQQAELRNHLLRSGIPHGGKHTAKEAFAALAQPILAPLNANGAALLGANTAEFAGECPSPETCRRLFAWLQSRHGDQSAVSFPDAPRQLDFPWPSTASGLLASSLGPASGLWLVFFRPELLREQRWSSLSAFVGNDTRSPFGSWTEVVRGCSHSWTEPEIDCARSLALTLRNGQLVQERERTETKLCYSEQRRAAMLAAMPDVLFVLDKEGFYLDAHVPAGSDDSPPKAELLGKSIREIKPADVAVKFFEAIALLTSGAQTEVKINYSLRGPGRGLRHRETRMVVCGPGQFLCIARDITDSETSRLALQEERTILRTIFDDAQTGFWDHDMQRGVAYYSPPCKALLGYSDEEFPDHPDAWRAYAFPEDTAMTDLAFAEHVATRGRSPFGGRIRHRHKNGSTRHFLASSRVISWGPGGEPLRVVGCGIDITALVEAQEENNRLALVTRHTGDSVIFTDTNRRITWVNDSFVRITGYTPEEVIGRTPAFLQGYGTDQATLAAIHAALETKQHFRGELLNYTKDGDPYWNQLEIIPHVSQDGRHVGFISVQSDITAQKKTENLLDRERRLFATGPVAVVINANTPGWPVVYVSENISSLIGYSARELTAPDFDSTSRIHPDDFAALLAKANSTPAQNKGFLEFSYRLRHRDGGYRWIYMFTQSEYDAEGVCLHYKSYLIDQTKLRQAQDALRERDAQLEAISRHVPGVLFEFCLLENGRSFFPYVSNSVRPIFGLTPEDVGTDSGPFFARVHPEDRAWMQDRIAATFLKRSDFEADFRILHPQHGLRWIHASCSPRQLEDGSYVWDGYASDITDRKHAEDEALRQGKREAIERLAGGIAHDFNNYLAAMSLTVEMILSLHETPPRVMRLLGNLMGEIKAATHVARQLLAFSKEQPVHHEPLLLDTFLRETACFALRGSSVSSIIDLPDPALTVSTDPNLLQQILFNLLINARQAMNEKGAIMLTARLPEPGKLQLSVRDTGPGIPAALGKTIFEPYVTSKKTGSGLGLHVVHTLVERLKGTITLLPGSAAPGATFVINLPINTESPAATPPPAEAEPPQPSARPAVKRLLVLEDNELQARMLTEFFRSAGLEVVAFANGSALLDAAAAHQDLGPRLACLLDITITGGEGGLEIAPALRKHLPDARIILMSGYSEAWKDRAQSMKPYNIDFIAKPYKLTDLKKLVCG